MNPGILTLTTDFGTDGPYVAVMKGVVLGLAPGTQLIDVSHHIAPQNILEGAFVLASILDYFPGGTVHLAVIDPGVGTDRKLKALKVADQWVLGPDNGLLGGVCQHHPVQGIWEISNQTLWGKTVSSTFHGRDILAPVAAFLLRGGLPDELGPRQDRVVKLANLTPSLHGQEIIGEVIFRDSFGNLITNVRQETLAGRQLADWQIEIAGAKISGLIRTYGDCLPGEVVALIGSSGYAEIAVVNGDASRSLMAVPGCTVWFRPISESV